MAEYEEGFDLFATAPIRVKKETEEEKRSRQLNERREALGLRPVGDRWYGELTFAPGSFYFDRSAMWEEMRKWMYETLERSMLYGSSLYEFKGLDLGVKGPQQFSDIWRVKPRDIFDFTPTTRPILVPKPHYRASTATIDPAQAAFNKYNRVSPPTEPAWLKLRGKY